MITAISAAILAFLFFYLSMRTISLRGKRQVSLGHGNHEDLQRAIRAHANFAEYTPFTLILLYILEMLMGAHWFVVIVAVCATLGRCLHAYGISQVSGNRALRAAGMALTFLAILSAAIAILIVTITNNMAA